MYYPFAFFFLIITLIIISGVSVICEEIPSGLDSNSNYPTDSLLSPGNLFPLADELPDPRVHFAMAIGPIGFDTYVFVHGGYAEDKSFKDDLNMYDTRSQRWSGPLLRYICCDNKNEDVNIMSSDTYDATSPFPKTSLYFTGDLPLARAEHKATFAGSLGYMYLFGGLTSLGFMNDFHVFDPLNLMWHTVDTTTGSSPDRRAGHSMTSFSDDVYIYGGRSSSGNNLYALNDVWRFNEPSRSWTRLQTRSISGSDSIPLGRQYAAIAILQNTLFIYGGQDPVTGLILSDLWSFNLHRLLWSSLTATKTSDSIGFQPPGLYKANMLFIDDDCEISVPSQSMNPQTGEGIFSDATCGLLIYGGISGSDLTTSLGQVYRININFRKLAAPDIDYSSEIVPQYLAISAISWEYARLTDFSSDRGRLRKLFAYEEIVFSPTRHLMYEFGGLKARTSQLVSDHQIAVGPYPTLSLDSGGFIGGKLWDTSTGEYLRTNVDIPTFAPWTFLDFFGLSQPLVSENNSDVIFLQKIRIYTVDYKDIVELI